MRHRVGGQGSLTDKGKCHSMTCLCNQRAEAELELQPIAAFVLDGVINQHHIPSHFTPRKDSVSFVEEAGGPWGWSG